MKTPMSAHWLCGWVILSIISGCLGHSFADDQSKSSDRDLAPAPVAELMFNSGFEPGTAIYSNNPQFSGFKGVDLSVPKPNDWLNDFLKRPDMVKFEVDYEQGDSTKRSADIVPDPVNPNNKVLRFSIFKPNVVLPESQVRVINGIVFDKKARIQMDMYGRGLKEVFQSVRLYLPPDFNILVNSEFPGEGDWITLFEVWNRTAAYDYPFRFGIGLNKGAYKVGSPLYYRAEAQKIVDKKFVNIWSRVNTAFPVPIGKWVTLEYYIKEGHKDTGRFYFAVTPDGGSKTVVFDLKGDTCHPDDPNPDGLFLINPLKLYTSGHLVDVMNAAGGTMQVYWDDFKFWKNKKP